MAEIINLAGKIERQLPTELVDFLRRAGEIAARQGQSLYLVGGVVRDLFLGRSNLDLDLVVEGDALNLAGQLTELKQGKITTHPRFLTAKLQWQQWSVDFATARSESYARPGALPTVKPGTLADDLFRRDFTINAMALRLTPSHYGELIDLYRGKDDLNHKIIRVLHERGFIDDSTRIWRGLRYEQRLNFQLEPNTLALLKRDTPMLDSISGDRIRHELELILKEESPEKILARAEELKVLSKLHPALRGNGWLTAKFREARQQSSPNPPSVGLYLALLSYHFFKEEREELISRLRLPKPLTQTLRDINSLKARLETLADPELAPSRVYHLLHGCSLTAITAISIGAYSPAVRQHSQTFLTRLRYVKPALTGDDLLKMGIAPGPHMKEILQRLHDARLDGEITNKKGEEELVRGWVIKTSY